MGPAIVWMVLLFAIDPSSAEIVSKTENDIHIKHVTHSVMDSKLIIRPVEHYANRKSPVGDFQL